MKPRISSPSSAYIRTMNATGMFQRIWRVTCSFIWAPAAKKAARVSLIRPQRMNSIALHPGLSRVVDRPAVVLDGFEPGGQCVRHSGDAIGLLRGEIVPLEGVVDDIEELGR